MVLLNGKESRPNITLLIRTGASILLCSPPSLHPFFILFILLISRVPPFPLTYRGGGSHVHVPLDYFTIYKYEYRRLGNACGDLRGGVKQLSKIKIDIHMQFIIFKNDEDFFFLQKHPSTSRDVGCGQGFWMVVFQSTNINDCWDTKDYQEGAGPREGCLNLLKRMCMCLIYLMCIWWGGGTRGGDV